MEANIEVGLVRKQFLISQSNIEKLGKIAEQKSTSSADIVRQAIDAYDPDNDVSMPELMELVSSNLQEAIKSTQSANKVMSNALDIISDKQG
jgi:replication initiation and membrane attachment protein DnaB